jgi:hypothetical protein
MRVSNPCMAAFDWQSGRGDAYLIALATGFDLHVKGF